MKKTLLTLLLLLSLGFAASAQKDELTSANFTGMAYGTSKTYTAASGVTYFAQASSQNGFQLRTSKKGTGVKNTTVLQGAIIESVEITFSTAGGGVNVYASDTEISLTSLPASTAGATTSNATIQVNKPYFAITATNDKYCQVSKIVVNWKTDGGDTYPTECPTPTFTVENGTSVYAGTEIGVVCPGAEDVVWTVNDGENLSATDKYVVNESEIGTTLTLHARASVQGETELLIAENEITVNVVEKPVVLEALFDFENEAETTYGFWPSGAVKDTYQSETVTINGVTLKATGRLTMFKGTAASGISNGWALRLYKPSNNVDGGKVVITAPAGCYLTKVESLSGSPVDAVSLAENTDTSITSIEYQSKTGTTTIKNIKVSFAPLPASAPEIVDFTHEFSHKARVATLNYVLHVNNHADDTEYTVTLNFTPTAGGETITETNEVHTLLAPEAAAAPARAAEATHKLSGTVGTESLTPATEYNVHVTYAVKGSTAEPVKLDLPKFTTLTTGIEDVTVEGTDAPAEYFNLQGVRVAQPEAGNIYIVRRGAKVTKELVK